MPMHTLEVAGRRGGGGGGATRSVMGDVHKHIFHQHCSQMKAVKTALRFKLIYTSNLFVLAPVGFAD